MNLRSIDLNLLVVIDAILDERHVSRAAARLGMTQPAASNALARGRLLFGDPLLQRSSEGMRITLRGSYLQAQIRDVLASVSALVDREQMDLGQLKTVLRLSMVDFPAYILAPVLHRRLREIAPKVDLSFGPWRGAKEAAEDLRSGKLDLACAHFPAIETDIKRTVLFRDAYKIVMRKGHPAAERFGLDAWLEYSHLVVSAAGADFDLVDDALGRLGRVRRVGLVCPGFLLAPMFLGGSDLMATLPSGCIPADRSDRFVIFDPPISLRSTAIHLAWHRRKDSDPLVATAIRVLSEQIAPAGGAPLATANMASPA